MSGESAEKMNLTLIKVKVIYNDVKTEKLSKYWNLSSSNMSYILDPNNYSQNPFEVFEGSSGHETMPVVTL